MKLPLARSWRLGRLQRAVGTHRAGLLLVAVLTGWPLNGLAQTSGSDAARPLRGTRPITAAQHFNLPTTDADGWWGASRADQLGTPVAEQVVREGDIDNFGFGWQIAGSPFDGRALRERPGLWRPPGAVDGTLLVGEDVPGTDRLLRGRHLTDPAEAPPEPATGNGVTETPFQNPVPISLRFLPQVAEPRAALLQIYLAGFQSPRSGSQFAASLNGQPWPELSRLLNALDLPPGGGRLITESVPAELLPMIATGRLQLLIEDLHPAPQDTFAIDFVRLLINPTPLPEGSGAVFRGQIIGDAPTGWRVRLQGQALRTGADGAFQFTGLHCGLSLLEFSADEETQKSHEKSLNGAIIEEVSDDSPQKSPLEPTSSRRVLISLERGSAAPRQVFRY